MRRWLARRRWRKQPPIEAWVSLKGVGGAVPVVLKPDEPRTFTNSEPITFHVDSPAKVTHVRVVGIDGKPIDIPLRESEESS